MLDTLKTLDTATGETLSTTIGGIGFSEILTLPDGIDAAIQHIQLSQDLLTSYEGQDFLKFHVRLSGQRVLVFQGRHTIELDGAATAVLMHDAGVPKFERIVANRDERAVTTMVARGRIAEYLDEEQAAMPAALHSLITRKRGRPRMAIAAPTRQELEIANAVIHCRRTGPLRRMFIEAKMVELFCLILDRLRTESAGPEQKTRVTERDRRQLARLRDFLSCSFTNPPTIHQLARQFGLNRNKLCSGFFVVYGMSIYDFCHSLRMEEARRMLLESQHMISEIALSTGYGSTSAFSAAFHRRFGHTPSQGRRGPSLRNIEVPEPDR
jgi:AraC family transcriptional activator of pyochelin receptor